MTCHTNTERELAKPKKSVANRQKAVQCKSCSVPIWWKLDICRVWPASRRGGGSEREQKSSPWGEGTANNLRRDQQGRRSLHHLAITLNLLHLRTIAPVPPASVSSDSSDCDYSDSDADPEWIPVGTKTTNHRNIFDTFFLNLFPRYIFHCFCTFVGLYLCVNK